MLSVGDNSSELHLHSVCSVQALSRRQLSKLECGLSRMLVGGNVDAKAELILEVDKSLILGDRKSIINPAISSEELKF